MLPFIGNRMVGRAGGIGVISRVRSVPTADTFGTVQVGDMVVVFLFYEGPSVFPSAPTGFTSIASGANSSFPVYAWRICYRIVTSAGETGWTYNGDYTNAIVHVYRSTGVLSLGSVASVAATFGTTATFNAVSPLNPNGGSWVVSADFDFNAGVLAGSVKRAEWQNSDASYMAMETWDTNGPVASWASRTSNAADLAAVRWQTVSFEIRTT